MRRYPNKSQIIVAHLVHRTVDGQEAQEVQELAQDLLVEGWQLRHQRTQLLRLSSLFRYVWIKDINQCTPLQGIDLSFLPSLLRSYFSFFPLFFSRRRVQVSPTYEAHLRIGCTESIEASIQASHERTVSSHPQVLWYLFLLLDDLHPLL